MANTPTLSRSVEYVFRLADNVAVVSRANAQATREFGDAVDNTTDRINRQNITYIKTVASLGAFRHGLRSMQMGLQDLGIISKQTHKWFYDMVNVIDIWTGVALAIKGVIGLMGTLRSAQIGVAVVETYRKVLQNPGAAALAVGAGVATGAIGGYLYGKWTTPETPQPYVGRGNVNVEQNVYFQGGDRNSDQRYAARSALEGMGF
jgi:hypothetical protein